MNGQCGPRMGSPWQQQLQECGPPCRLQLQGPTGGGVQTQSRRAGMADVEHCPQLGRMGKGQREGPMTAPSTGSRTPGTEGPGKEVMGRADTGAQLGNETSPNNPAQTILQGPWGRPEQRMN